MNFRLPLLRLFAAGLAFHGAGARAAAPTDPAKPAASPWVALARGRVEPPGGVVQVAASRDGIVKDLLAHDGDEVAQGAPLAKLDDQAAQLNRALAERELAQTHAALAPLLLRQTAAAREERRLEQLVAQQLANAQDLDRARDRAAGVAAEISQATAAEDTARARLALAHYEVEARVVRAPMAGQIVRRLVSPGEGASAQTVTPLFWLAPRGPRVVIAQLDELSVPLVASGQRAEVVTESDPNRIIAATVQKVGLLYGSRRPATDDPAERQDVRVVDCVLALDDTTPPLLIGQRVLVRFLRAGQPAR